MRRVLRAQGAYYLGTGVSPFVSRRMFEAVTGPKTEWWLVQTVGALAGVIGATLLAAGARDEPPPAEVVGLAAGSALAFAALDFVHVARGRIAPTYLVDAVAQAALLAGMGAAARQRAPGGG